MFKDIFPEESCRFVYQQAKKGPAKGTAPAESKEAEGKKAEAEPKAEVDHKAEGQKMIEQKLNEYTQAIFDSLKDPSTSKERALTLLTFYHSMQRHTGDHPLFLEAMDFIPALDDYEKYLLTDAQEQGEYPSLMLSDHKSALHALRYVPFHKVLEWYEGSNNLGQPFTKGTPDRFPKEIDYMKVGAEHEGDTPKKRGARARQILWETVNHFLTKSGGKERLKHFQKTAYQAGMTPERVTWEMVMCAGLDPSEIAKRKKAKKKGKG
jgi:hypothetical protein